MFELRYLLHQTKKGPKISQIKKCPVYTLWCSYFYSYLLCLVTEET